MALECLTLTDAESGSVARVLVGSGFNCFQFQVPHAGRLVDVVAAEEGFESGTLRPTRSGIPVLFPFPGRLRGMTYRWRNRTYDLSGRARDDGNGNAIHGFVFDRPWRVLEGSDRRVVGQFQGSVDDPAARHLWPSDYRITLTYELSGSELVFRAFLENPGDDDLPCGLGIHPYFALPLGGESPESCRITVPIELHWEAAESLLTGRKMPVPREGSLASGQDFGGMQYDDVYRLVEAADGEWHRAEIFDPGSRRTLAIEFEQVFPECVVFTPPRRPAVCVEPYSCVPNALELADRGVDTGLRVLAPGESFEGAMRLRLE